MKQPNEHVEEAPARAADRIETDLLALVAQTDTAAFEKLYKIYYGRLFRFVIRTLGRTDSADEIINDVMFVVWTKAADFNRQSRPSTWIFGIAYNKVRQHFGRRKHAALFDSFSEMVEPVDDRWQTDLELEQMFAKLFDTLSPEQRLLVELAYFHGMHYREIAQIMRCPENTVKTRMFHIRRKLGALLENGRGYY